MACGTTDNYADVRVRFLENTTCGFSVSLVVHYGKVGPDEDRSLWTTITVGVGG